MSGNDSEFKFRSRGRVGHVLGKTGKYEGKREIKMRCLPQTGDRSGKDGSPAPFPRQHRKGGVWMRRSVLFWYGGVGVATPGILVPADRWCGAALLGPVVVIALSRAIVVIVVVALPRAVVAAIARHCAPLTLLAVCNSCGVPLRIIAHR